MMTATGSRTSVVLKTSGTDFSKVVVRRHVGGWVVSNL